MNESDQQSPKQLSMLVGREAVQQLPEVGLPDGYLIRGYQSGDEKAWVDLLPYGDFSEWSVERFDQYMEGLERKQGSRIVSIDREIVAATFATQQDEAQKIGRLDYVVSHPNYRGKGLGRVVCTAVLRFLIDRGYESVILFTDDWRLPAIGLYLSLGFVPQITRDDMPIRWEAVKKQLVESRNERS